MEFNSIFNQKLMQEAVAKAEKHREYLHTVPEKAFEEHRTTAYIRKVCEEYPVKTIDIGMETGLVCFLDTGSDETIALRTDIDAVPTQHGPEHLCGHDAHTSSMLGAMHYLCGVRDTLKYNVLFIFQPAEEGTHGARAMLDHGLLDKVPQRPVRIFGIHNRPEVTCGDVVVHRGPLMSEKSVFRITITGKPGHGAMPHKCIDPIPAVGTLITSLQTIVSRNIDPFLPVICTINSVTAGESDNSAPESAVLTGYIRSFNHDAHKRMEQRLVGLAEGTAKAYECRCSISITPMVPAVDNSEEMYHEACKAAAAALGEEHITDSDPCLASEDFAVYGTELPSFLYWVGSGTPGRENAPWHDRAFRVDPHYTENAIPVLCASVLA
jgi:hippurate hydrolase